ncbi:hypothetical protein [Dictyobacter halimunensis]|uniref:hypothetical protein n=1 Tax=Dictyobacter halimunensis TaxID=3026934 RepID=UPI0030C65B01
MSHRQVVLRLQLSMLYVQLPKTVVESLLRQLSSARRKQALQEFPSLLTQRIL